MAERKQVNKYYPPDWDPVKHGSVNKYQGVHPLRERARKLHQGILIIRFEMPYNIWCEGCENHIGTGVRYNAEKSKTGKYYSTTIYKFRMKCHLCDNYIEMETDPQNLDYKILSGARRQERRWDPTQNEQIVPEDKEISKQRATDPMMRLEHGVEDKRKKDAAAPVIEQLEKLQERMKDNFACNQLLRKKFRCEKKDLKAIERSDKKLLDKSSLDIALLPEDTKDIKLAGLIKFETIKTDLEVRKSNRKRIMSEPIFAGPSSTSKKSTQLAKIANAITSKRVESMSSKTLSKERLGIITKTSTQIASSAPVKLVKYDESDSE